MQRVKRPPAMEGKRGTLDEFISYTGLLFTVNEISRGQTVLDI